MVTPVTISRDEILDILETVHDPEIPALSILDMGIVRDVNVSDSGIEITITPTYSGCPAMKWIEDEIRTTLEERGFCQIKVSTILSPPWTTDWISAEGKEKLKTYGIAPPLCGAKSLVSLKRSTEIVPCPFCDSSETERKSDFGSTPCKTFYFCRACEQPFEYFKQF